MPDMERYPLSVNLTAGSTELFALIITNPETFPDKAAASCGERPVVSSALETFANEYPSSLGRRLMPCAVTTTSVSVLVMVVNETEIDPDSGTAISLVEKFTAETT